ncbi:TPA: hypothetical protein ACG3P3_001480 [Clostridioides difficile]
MVKHKVITTLLVLMMCSTSLINPYAENGKGAVVDGNVQTDLKDDGKGNIIDSEGNIIGSTDIDVKNDNNNNNENKPPVNSSDVKDDNSPGPGDVIVNDGMYLRVELDSNQNEVGYIPSVEIELQDANGKYIDKVLVNEKNFDKKENCYLVKFNNVTKYKLGDKFKFCLREKSDNVVKSILMLNDDGSSLYVNRDKVIEKIIGPEFNILNNVEGSLPEGAKNAPMRVKLITDTNLVAIKVLDMKDNPVKNFKVDIERTLNNLKYRVTTNDQGLIWLTRNKVEPRIVLNSVDKKFEFDTGSGQGEIVYPTISSKTHLDSFMSNVIKIRNVETSGPANTQLGKINLNFKSVGNTDLSKNWTQVTISLKNKKTGVVSKFEVSSKDKYLEDIPIGEYSVSVEANYATTNFNKNVTVSSGAGNLNLTVFPRNKLQIYKELDGKRLDYKFSVINVEAIKSKEYKGKNPIDFCVMPGETFMIQDNETNEVFTVDIPQASGVTTLILGEGKILNKKEAISPHTRDMLPLQIGILSIAGVVAVLSLFIALKDDKKKFKNNMFMFLLISSILLSTPMKANADSGGSSGGGSGGGSAITSDQLIVNGYAYNANYWTLNGQNVNQVVMFGFVPNTGSVKNGQAVDGSVTLLTEDATENDIVKSYKFSSEYMKYCLFMPVNKSTETDFKNSGILGTYSDGTYYLIAGKDRIFGQTNADSLNSSEMTKRVVGTPSAVKSNANKVLSTMGNALASAEKDSKGVYKVNYGDGIGNTIRSKDDAWKQQFFNDYINLMKSKGVSQKDIDYIQSKYESNEVTFLIQTMPRLHLYSKGKPNGMYMPTSYISMALGLADSKKVTGNDEQQRSVYFREYKYLYSRGGTTSSPKSGYCTKSGCSSWCKRLGHISSSGWKPMQGGYVNTIQAINSGGPVKKNIFGGWGYHHWKAGQSAKAPKLFIQAKIDLYNSEGAKVGTIAQPAKDWQIGKEFKLCKDISKVDLVDSTIESNGKTYKIEKEAKNKIDLVDKKDKEGLFKDTLKINTPSTVSKEEALVYDTTVNKMLLDLLKPNQIDEYETYLGGEQNADNDFDINEDFAGATAENKYKDKKNDKGEREFSDAEMTVYLKAKEIPSTVDGTGEEAKEVPEWRLSKYWDDLSSKLAYAIYKVSHSSDSTSHVSSSLNPSGWTNLSLKDVDLKASPWLKINAKWKGTPHGTSVTHGGTTFSQAVGGSLVATRTNRDIDTYKFANWKNNGYTNEIVAGDKGDTNYKYRNKKTMNSNIEIYMLDPITSYIHKKANYRHTTNSEGHSVCRCYTSSETATQKYTPATYKLAIDYYRYHTGDVSTKVPQESKGEQESYSYETKKTTPLKVYPEVTMAHSDLSGNTAIDIIAGEKQRTITPLSYNYLRLDAKMNSKVVGTSVATDKKAKSLVSKVASGTKVGSAQVIHKGSAVNLSYTLGGTGKLPWGDKPTLTAKTYALDIGNTAVKNSWGNSSYNTDKVRDSYMNKFGTKTGDGWKFKLKIKPSMNIGGKDYNGKEVTKDITGKNKTTEEYRLVVRSGKLTLVNGKGVSSVNDETKDILSKMKLNTQDTLLDVFEKSKGKALDEANVANLINAVRGTNDVKVGAGWYNEDTTVLIIREYTTVFELPKAYMYTDKIAMNMAGIESPISKNDFYTKGLKGHTKLKLTVDKSDCYILYDDTSKKVWNDKEMKFTVPNVSILDTTK